MAIVNYTESIILDINTDQACPVVSAKQGDNARQLKVQIQDRGTNILIDPSKQTVGLRIRKPDRHIVFNDTSINNDGTVMIKFSYDCLNAAGRAYADLIIFNTQFSFGTNYDEPAVSTVSFIIDIMPSPALNHNVNDVNKALESDEFSYLSQFVDRGSQLYKNTQYINFDIDTNPSSETRGQLLLYSTNINNNTLQFNINNNGWLQVTMPGG